MGKNHNCSNFGGSDGCPECMNDLKAEVDGLKNLREKLLKDWSEAAVRASTAELQNRELHQALGSMLESFGACIGETMGSKTPLPPLAIDVVKGFFLDAKNCNEVYHKYAEKKDGV